MTLPAQDNNCCFNAIGYLLEGRSRRTAAALRAMVAEVVNLNRELYTEAVLGRSNTDYQRWITNPTKWGGMQALIG